MVWKVQQKPVGEMSTKSKEIPDDKPMDQKHKNTLRRCRSKLVDDMEPEKVLLHMEDPLLLTEEDENKIKAGHLTRRQQVKVLLDIISRKGDKAYETLMKTIEKVHPHLTSTILEAEKEELENSARKTPNTTGLETENNRLESKIKTMECEMEQLREERDNIATANADSLQEIKDLKKVIKEVNKYKSAVSRALLPRGEDLQSPGAICTIGNDGLANVVATRSSEGPGEADDVLNSRLGKEVTCGTKELRGSWWRFDLGENYFLFPTHYSLRHGKKEGDSILRQWKLQGSIDGKDWKDIVTHRRKGDFAEPFPYATDTWSVEGEVGAFRYLQIVQTGRHSSNLYGMYLSGMEFYGILLKV